MYEDYLDKYIRELLEEAEHRRMDKFFNEQVVPVLKEYQKSNFAKRPMYYERSYKDTPTIYNQPSPEISAKKDSKINEVLSDIKTNVDKTIDWIKNEPKILSNSDIDYSKKMILHESVTDTLIKSIGKVLYPVSSDMYTDGMTDLSRAKSNKNADVMNINDIKDKNLQKSVSNMGVSNDEKVVHYNSESKASKLFSNSPEIRKVFKDNEEAIRKGELKEYNVDFEANARDLVLNPAKSDRHTSIQHGTLTDLKINDKGQGEGKLIDKSDFKWRNPDEYGVIKAAINNHGYNMQEKGNYKPYFSITDIVSDKENPEEKMKLLRRLQRMLGL